MNRGTPFLRITTPALALVAGCFLDTKPIATHELGATTGPSVGNAGASGSDMSPPQVMTGSAGHDSATADPADAGTREAATPVVTTTPPPAASGMSDAGTAPPPATTPSDAGSTKPPSAQCDGLGSYGLRAALDVTWDATAWSDVGRGTVELYGLVQVDAIDPMTHALSASFRACGLTLPTLNSSALCSSYELQFPESTWETSDRLPAQKLAGTYKCDGAACTLKLEPASYAMGIRLAEPHGDWPKVEDTTLAQFSDDDADGFPGVSVDVVSVASLPSGQNGCTGTGSPTGPSQGPGSGSPVPGNQGNQGNQGPGNQGSGNQGNPWAGTPTPFVPTQIGQLLLGLRTQLTAAMQLSSDCELQETTASDASLGLRAAGCFVTDGTDPSTATLGCSEELRASYDETLPQYEVLEKGKAPKASGPGAGPSRKEPSAGTILKAVRFAPGTQVGCEEARGIML
jgi:hypothetical protein